MAAFLAGRVLLWQAILGEVLRCRSAELFALLLV